MKKSNLLSNILAAGLLAGTLDIFAAIVFLANMKAAATFKHIASGAFGQAAFSGGAGMVAWGVVFHYFIALSFAAGYFLAYPHLPVLKKNKWVAGLLYGAFAWAVMNLLVLPMTSAPAGPLTWSGALKNMTILALCIGLPVAWLAGRFFSEKPNQE